ncbi:MAG: alpha-ketoacid dehydrogenase subunit beta [Gammaproteobacteria bacterium]|nr:alpha-ketoacid dehydrogenase subunit beta [Gammaproteobacteria bacterium]
MARTRFIQAVNDAIREDMERDEKVILFGEDVEASIFGDTRGLIDVFGPRRVRNTPISENTLTGMTVGTAASGYRVILHLMFANFIYTGMDGIANQMARARLMSGGQIQLPITIIASYGGGRANAAQHSDTPFGPVMNISGVHVVAPANPADAKGLLKSAIRCNDPVIFLEPGGRGGEMGEVSDEEYLTPIGKASVLREGTDVTLISMGSTMRMTLQAADELANTGISSEVVDVRSLAPLDEDTLCKAASRTGKVVIVDESRDRCSAASHIAAVIADRAFNDLRAPVKRVTTPDSSLPYAPASEKFLLPNTEKIVTVATQLSRV